MKPAVQELSSTTVRLVPLGGLGEIGMNCLAVEQQDGIVVIDCGTTFPHDDVGVQLIRPDFSWLEQRGQRVCGVFITHGHEDHIGALPYLLQTFDRDVPVFGPPHAMQLVARRFEEHELDASVLREVEPGRSYDVGPFSIEPIHVSHSIVDATALALRTRAGTLLHTGDFDLDPSQPAGEPIDEARFRALGREGIRLLLSDSTNVDVPNRAVSEADVGRGLERLIEGAPGRVVVSLFASNVHRLKMLGEIAERTGRRICLLGRSLINQSEAAREIERLHWKSDLVVPPELVASLPRDRVLALAGGSQAEWGSAMRRLASMSHPNLKLDPADVVIFSSRIIPGNDRAVFEMMNDLLRLGVVMHTRVSDPDVHTSGHASRAEQEQMLEWTRPDAFLPVHGTLHHLMRHEELARKCGVEHTAVVENGTPVLVDRAGPLRPESPVEHGAVCIAWGGSVLDEPTKRRRAEMARYGVALVTIVLDRERRLLAPPRVSTRGVPELDRRNGALAAVERAVSLVVERSRKYRLDVLDEQVRTTVRREVAELCGIRPLVEVHVVRAPG